MISLGFVSAGGGRYYTDLAREDYYVSGGESPGRWFDNQAARDFGVSGAVEKPRLERLFDGYGPSGTNPLGQNAGKADRRAAIDLCFSPPKDYSSLWAVADEADRRRLEGAFQRAVDKTLIFVNDECGYTRRGHGGAGREKVDLLFAKFTHRSSRAQDPQLHEHVLIINTCKRDDGTFGAVDAGYVLHMKKTAGAYFRSALAHEIAVPLERDPQAKFSFRVPGVPEALSAHWSSRSKAILEEIKTQGVDGARAKALAALSTRAVKGHRALGELREEWAREAEARGLTPADAGRILGRRRGPLAPDQERKAIDAAVASGVKELTRGEAHFTREHLIRETCISTVDRGIDPDRIKARVDEALRDDRFVALDRSKGRYTTREIFVEVEGKALAHAKALGETTSRASTDRALREAIARSGKEFNPGQREAASKIVNGPDLVVIQGPPGSGKTTMLKAARDALEKNGEKVIGLCPSNRAARELQASSGIKSHTLDRFLHDQERTAADKAKHHLLMLGRTAVGKPTWKYPSITVDRGTTLVVDECSMADNAKLAKVLDVARRNGCRVAMLGDQRQLPAIGQGGLFREISDRARPEQKAALTEIVRQREAWTREAIAKFGKGETREALQAYQDRGHFQVLPTKDDAQKRLVATWRLEGAANPKDHLMLAATNDDVRALNAQAQEARQRAGALGWKHASVGGEKIHEGDRVLFTANRKQLGVVNSDFGTVQKVDVLTRRLTVAVDGVEKPVSFSLWKFDSVRLGYAATVHRAQGMTLDQNAYVLFGGSMQSREMTYVQISRARGETHLFADEKTTPDRRDVERQAARSVEKRAAHGMAREPRQPDRTLTLNLSL